MDEHHKVMTEHLTERFVDHRNIGLAAKGVPEFTLHHAEGGFDIRPPMVVVEKLIPLEHEVMEHLRKGSASGSGCRPLERDKRSAARLGNSVRVGPTAVSLVCGDFRNGEVLGGSFDHRSKHQRIVRVHLFDFHGGYDVRLDAAHEISAVTSRQCWWPSESSQDTVHVRKVTPSSSIGKAKSRVRRERGNAAG